MKEISNHISYREATVSQTAIRLGIENTPDANQFASMVLVAEKVFEPLRVWYNAPIRISSFFRSAKLNKAIKGAKISQHAKGEAIDLDTDHDNAKLFMFIKDKMAFDQLIWEFGDDANPDWVHVSYSKNNRKEVLRAVKENSKTVYKPFV